MEQLGPDLLVAGVLARVDQEHRLGTCALVSTTWRRAAAAASSSIVVSNYTSRADSLAAWMSAWGGHVTSLVLSHRQLGGGVQHGLVQLPCPRLLSLDVSQLQLQPSLLSACSSLTSLALHHCQLSADTALAQLPRLKHLVLGVLLPGAGADQQHVPLPAVVGQLASLTHLSLAAALLPAASEATTGVDLSCLAALTGLRALQLTGCGQLAAAVLSAALECVPWVTSLAVSQGYSIRINAADTPGLTALTGLRELRLVGCRSVEPALLASFRQLQHLELSNTAAAAATRPRHAADTSGGGGSGGGGASPSSAAGAHAELLAAVAALQQLTHLGLHDVLKSTGQANAPDAAAYAALTAAPRLVHLDLSYGRIPSQAWQHVFTAGRQLGLHVLVLSHKRRAANDRMRTADLARLVDCCPALRNLQVDDALEWGASLAPITALRRLTALHIGGLAGAGVGPLLARLTSLRVLHTVDVPEMGDGDLCALTALTGLRVFWATGRTGFSTQLARLQHISFTSKAPADAPPDTWLQLLERCAQSDQCRAQLLQQHATMAATCEAQRVQLAVRDEQVEQLQAEAAELRRRLAALVVEA